MGSPSNVGDTLSTQSFDGTHLRRRAPTVNGGGIAWSKIRGAFWAGGKLFYGYDDGFLYSRTYKKGVFGPAVKLDPYHDPVLDRRGHGIRLVGLHRRGAVACSAA